ASPDHNRVRDQGGVSSFQRLQMICPDRCTIELIGTYRGIKVQQVYRCKWCTVTSYRSVEMDKEQLIAEMAVENAELKEQVSGLTALLVERDADARFYVDRLEDVRSLAEKWRSDYAEAAEMEGEYPVHHHYGRRHADELEVALTSPESLVECNQCHERLTMDEFKRRGADDCDEGYAIVRAALASPAGEQSVSMADQLANMRSNTYRYCAKL